MDGTMRKDLEAAEREVMNSKIFQRFITAAEKQEQMKSTLSSTIFDKEQKEQVETEEKIYSMKELMAINPK